VFAQCVSAQPLVIAISACVACSISIRPHGILLEAPASGIGLRSLAVRTYLVVACDGLASIKTDFLVIHQRAIYDLIYDEGFNEGIEIHGTFIVEREPNSYVGGTQEG
jgi:hypothetical protein